MNYEFPILIVGYKRVDETIRMINEVINYGFKNLYLAIDGDSDLSTKKKWENELARLKSEQLDINVKVWHRETNLKLACSMITAIDWIFKFETKAIILEDDLHFDKRFFSYISDNFHYVERGLVFMLSGNRLIDSENKSQLLNYPLVWGWAINRKNWLEFRREMFSRMIFDKKVKLSTQIFWLVGRKRAINCKIESWAIIFASYIRSKNKNVLLPNENLIENRGTDLHSTHTKSTDWFMSTKIGNNFGLTFIELNQNTSSQEKLNLEYEQKLYFIKQKHILMFPLLLCKNDNTLSKRLQLIRIPTISS